MQDSYKTIARESQGYFRDKGSKFYAFAYHVESEEEVKERLTVLRKEHHSARHHCYAWRIGTENIQFRANDDGEPSSTAGKPILGQLQSKEITNALIVVVRYFGGTLLGVSGLINAYRNAAADAILNAEVVERIIETSYKIHFTYNEMNDVMHLLKQAGFNIRETRFEEGCSLVFSVRKSEAQRAENLFRDLYKVKMEKV